MLRNYLAAALRNLARNRLYAAINIVGLALSLAAALLIALFVRNELSFDRWIPAYQDVYRVVLGLRFGNFQEPPSSGAAAPVAGWLKADFPQISAAARMQAQSGLLARGAIKAKETVYWADPDIFAVLPLPALTGNLRDALKAPDALVLTQRMARKYFADSDPIGQVIEIDGKFPFRVTAVLQDLPSQTHLDTEIFAAGHSVASPLPAGDAPLQLHVGFDALTSVLTYIRLQHGADAGALQLALPAMAARHVAVPKGPDGKPWVPEPTVQMQPLASLHFVPAGLHAMKPAGNIETVYATSAVGVLILLVATCNFVNLVTARAARRAVEIGVRKASGATRRDLVLQFIGESLLTVAISSLIAVSIAELLLPTLNAFLSREIVFEWWRDPAMAGGILAMTVVTGLLGGFYPAFVLAHFRPTVVLKGGPIQADGQAAVRQMLVAAQFAVLIGLMFATAAIYRQTRFATQESLRFDQDQVLVIDSDCRNALPQAVKALAGVRAAACTDTLFGIGGALVWFATPPGGSVPLAHSLVSVDWGLLDLFGLRPIAGRLFSRSHPGDATDPPPTSHPDTRLGSGGAVVINRSAARNLGFSSPATAIGHVAVLEDAQPAPKPPVIIGVVEDFELQGIRHEIQPTFFRLMPGRYQYLIVKLEGHAIPETLRAIDELWRRLGNGEPIHRRFLNSAIQSQYLDMTREAGIFAIFSAVAVSIAALGLFGLSAYIAERRIKEIGIRKSLGASATDIVRLLNWQFCKPVLWANLFSLPIAGYCMNRWLHGFFYHVGLDWWLFAASGIAALMLALATVTTRSLLVARAQPVTALRYE